MSLTQDDDRSVLQSDDAGSEEAAATRNGDAGGSGLPAAQQEVTPATDEDIDAIPEFDENVEAGEGAALENVEAAEKSEQTQSLQQDERPDSSLDETASIPDDTPSVQGSALSSPSRTPSMASPLRNQSPSSLHRPFDRRFHSRISSSPMLTPRAQSPNFLTSHSRQSSLTSIAFPPPSEPDEATAPWEVIRWTKLKKLSGHIFSEVGKRNFGSPTSLSVTDQIVIGTSRGMVLIFDHQQAPRGILGAGTKAVESGPVTALAISADHTTVAAGHATGHIFTWEISRPGRPFLHILPIENAKPQARKGDGHLTGSSVVHIGFLGFRRTALVSADDKGMAFSHLATRGMGAVARTVRTTRILGRYPEVISRSSKPLKKSSVLAFSPLPLGNVEQTTDGLGLVAMLTPYLLVIVSTTPVAQTQHKAARPKEVTAHGAMTAALAWFPAIKLKGSESEASKAKLAYAWSNVLTILEVYDVPSESAAQANKPPELQFLARGRFKAEEPIVAIQWLSRSVLAVLTITQQLLILEDISMAISDSFDLLPKNVYHADLYSQQLQAVIENLDEEDTSMHGVVADAFHMSFRAYKGRLFLLGCNDIWWGSLTNWADRLLALMNVGDFIAAIRLATRYYSGHGERMTIGLPEETTARTTMVGEKLFEMMSASLRYAFGKNQQAGNEPVEKTQLVELAEACIAACLATDDKDFLFDEVFTWYNDNEQGDMFMDVLEPYILDSRIITMPPPALKVLVDHFAVTHTPAKLEEIICLLDTTSMDIDRVTSLCKKYNLFDAYIYVWNRSLGDFVTPLEELLQLAVESQTSNGHTGAEQRRLENAQKIFPYLSFILTSRTYPTGLLMENELADLAKSQVYGYFFSAAPSKVQSGTKSRRFSMSGGLPYSNLRRVLTFDTPSFIASLNEAFEDSFLNSGDDDAANGTAPQSIALQRTSYNRQFIVRIMLEVMSTGFEAEDTIYLDMFIARNLPKYPQYMLLSGTTMHEIFIRLCQYPVQSMREDAQLSVEYLMSKYRPSNMHPLIPLLREAEFYRVLKTVFRQENQYTDVVTMYFADQEDQDSIFDVLVEFLRTGSVIPDLQRNSIVVLMKQHAEDLIRIDVRRTAMTVDDVGPTLHEHFLESFRDDTFGQFEYLNALYEPESDAVRRQKQRNASMLELFVRLMCQFQPEHVSDFVETVREGDMRLQQVVPTMEKTGIIDAAIVLEARSGQVRESMNRLAQHLSSLQGALHGLLAEKGRQVDSYGIQEATEDILSSVEKYSKVGIWLCRGQSKISQKSKGAAKSPKRSNSIKQPLSLEETLWLDLIESVVAIAQGISQQSKAESAAGEHSVLQDAATSLRRVIQQVFTALLTATTTSRDPSTGANDLTFLRILRAFLSNAAKVSPSLSELRNVISSIFSAYAYEESLLSLSNAMLDKDVFIHLDHVKQLRVRGWRPRGQVCEVCRRRVWGPGLGERVWEQWQQKEEARALRRESRGCSELVEEVDNSQGKGKAAASPPLQEQEQEAVKREGEPDNGQLGPIVVFSCRHVYHQNCLSARRATDIGNELDSSEGQTLVGGTRDGLACPECAAEV
jgi:vacuolar protein sorting-associated protein 8